MNERQFCTYWYRTLSTFENSHMADTLSRSLEVAGVGLRDNEIAVTWNPDNEPVAIVVNGVAYALSPIIAGRVMANGDDTLPVRPNEGWLQDHD